MKFINSKVLFLLFSKPARVMNLKEKQNNIPNSVLGKQHGVNLAFTIFPPSYFICIYEKLHLPAVVDLFIKASLFDVSGPLHSC